MMFLTMDDISWEREFVQQVLGENRATGSIFLTSTVAMSITATSTTTAAWTMLTFWRCCLPSGSRAKILGALMSTATEWSTTPTS